MRDGADDSDHDDIPNLMELSRFAASGGSTATARVQGGSGPAEAARHGPPDAYGRVNPFNPCLPTAVADLRPSP